MSGIDLTEAVRAARPLLVQAFTDANALVESMLTAALPHLEQQIREQVAAEIEARQFLVESTHQFGYGANGWTCLCGFVSPVKRQRTEHITGELDAADIARTRKDT